VKSEPSENERGLERAIVKMALSAQEVELSPDDLPTMRRLTKTLQRYVHLTDNALEKKKLCRGSETPSGSRAARAA
jgi:hypothetical protein